MERKSLWQRSRDNIVATIIYGLLTFALTILYEKVMIGLEWDSWFGVRAIYIPIRYLLVFMLDYLIDYFRKILPKFIADGIALSLYQIPIYIFVSLVVGLNIKAIILASCIYVVDNFAFGWLYGYVLDRTRKFFLQQAF